MIVLGVFILGNLNKEATSEESLGKSFWQIVISSGILVVILGVVNLFAVSNHPSPVPSDGPLTYQHRATSSATRPLT